MNVFVSEKVGMQIVKYGIFAPTGFEVVLFEGNSTDPAIPEHANASPKVWTTTNAQSLGGALYPDERLDCKRAQSLGGALDSLHFTV